MVYPSLVAALLDASLELAGSRPAVRRLRRRPLRDDSGYRSHRRDSTRASDL